MNFYQYIFALWAVLPIAARAQEVEATKPRRIDHLGGSVIATNNGMSLLPTFSLGKPALMFEMSAGSRRLSFDPQFRFAMEGKPWSFVYWWRYKLVRTDKWSLGVGAHPAFVFKTVVQTANNTTTESLVAMRYVATEIAPNYFIKPNVSVGIYYLYSHGFDNGTTGNTHFITANANFSKIPLGEKYFMRFAPQIYYLKMDDREGTYITWTVTWGRNDFPVTLQSIGNKTIESNILGSKDFNWNVSLVYSFNREYK